MAYQQPTFDWIQITVNGYKSYIAKIDSTHVHVSSRPEPGGLSALHVEQLRGRLFYDDLKANINHLEEMDGNSYSEQRSF